MGRNQLGALTQLPAHRAIGVESLGLWLFQIVLSLFLLTAPPPSQSQGAPTPRAPLRQLVLASPAPVNERWRTPEPAG